MPANTPHGFPYPLPTEPVADGAQAIRNLAESLEPRLGLYKIADQTLSAAGTFDFPAIPQTYAHLLLMGFLRGDAAVAFGDIKARVNANATAVYDGQQLLANGTSIVAGGTAGGTGTSLTLGRYAGASSPAFSFGPLFAFVPCYASGAGWQTMLAIALARAAGGTATDNHLMLSGGFSTQGGTTVNRLTVFPDAGNFVAGSRLSLYGVG